MRKNIINKYALIIMIVFMQFIFLGSNKEEEKTVKLTEVFHKYLLTKNQDIFMDSIEKRIESVSHDEMGQSTNHVEINDETFYVHSYEFRNDLSSGNFLTLELLKKTDEERYLILKDIVHFESNNGLYVAISELSYGEKSSYGYYPIDETKFGIYDVDLSKGLPFYQKIIPRYIISVENEKLKIEVPTNEDYFIYLYDEI